MPRVKRGPRNSVNDRPGRLRLLLRRQRRLLRPGAWLAVVAVIGLVVTIAVHSSEPGGTLARWRERLLAVSGFNSLRVTNIVLEGRANTPEALLRATLGVKPGDPILGFSVAQAERRIETLSWVEHATVERRLPGTIVVRLQERRPFAIWQNQGKFVLIDRAGLTVTNQNVSDFRQLPLVVGPGAPEDAAPLIDALNTHPHISSRVVAAVRVGERRWNLQMKSGTEVLLPEGHEAVALDRLAQLEDQHKLLDRPFKRIDMRLPTMLVLHPISPATPVDAATHPGAAVKKQT